MFCAFTGKAALRMEQAGCRDAVTLHSLLYVPDEDASGRTRWICRKSGPIDEAGLVIVDEASMINEELARDLMSFGKPVLVLGDPAQLPPVKDDGFFMRQHPDIMLTAIERTASGNPLLDLRRLALGRSGALPEVGDRLIGLRNDGEQFTVVAVKGGDAHEDALVFEIQSLDQPKATSREVKVPPACCTQVEIDFRDWCEVQFLTYAYAITAHKSQGSEWDSVLVIDES